MHKDSLFLIMRVKGMRNNAMIGQPSGLDLGCMCSLNTLMGGGGGNLHDNNFQKN